MLTTAVRKARRALERGDRTQPLIRTVHGHGYRFTGGVDARHRGDVVNPEAVNRPSIAALPFAAATSDPEQEFFADAITADITMLLAKHRWLEVVSRHAVRQAVEAADTPRRLMGADLADYLVSGTVRRAGNRLRVTAELDDGRTERHLWGGSYDRQVSDLFAVQDDITRRVVGRLEPEIGMAERHKAARAQHPDLQAWECFHLALAHFFRFTAEDDREARRLLQRSRQLDPEFGEAHAWWAYATVLAMVYWDEAPSARLLDQALAAAQRALDLDDQNATFYALKARVQLARGEYQSAITGNRLAIELNPTLAVAYCSLADSLAYEGRYDEAMAHFDSALELSPNDPQRWAFLSYGALALLFRGDFGESLVWSGRAVERPNCQYWALAHRTVALAHLNRREEMERSAQALQQLKPEFSLAFARSKLFYIKRPEQIRCYLEGLERAGIPANRAGAAETREVLGGNG